MACHSMVDTNRDLSFHCTSSGISHLSCCLGLSKFRGYITDPNRLQQPQVLVISSVCSNQRICGLVDLGMFKYADINFAIQLTRSRPTHLKLEVDRLRRTNNFSLTQNTKGHGVLPRLGKANTSACPSRKMRRERMERVHHCWEIDSVVL